MIELRGSLRVSEESFRQSPSAELQKEGSSICQRARLKVLVVDDERIIADTVREILESVGFDVAVAYSGWEALEKVSRFKPDQLLTDVKMPGMNGVELAIAIRMMYPTTKILLFTAQAGVSELVMEAEKRGFHFELMAKPLRPSELIERLKAQ